MRRTLATCTLLLAIVPMVGCAYCANPQDYCGPVFNDGCAAHCDGDSRSGSVYGVGDVEVYIDEYSSTGGHPNDLYYGEAAYSDGDAYYGDEFYGEASDETGEYVDDRESDGNGMDYRYEESYGDGEQDVDVSAKKHAPLRSRMYDPIHEGPRKRKVVPVSYDEPVVDAPVHGRVTRRVSR